MSYLDNNLPPGVSPKDEYFNVHDIPYCEDCDTEMIFHDEGVTKAIRWTAWICPDCGNIESSEPNFE